MRIFLLAALLALPTNFSNAAETCSNIFNGPTDISADELAQVFQSSGVGLPESFPTEISDQAKARVRKLYQAIPNLLGRRLNLRLSLSDGQSAYMIGSLSSLADGEVLISLDNWQGRSEPFRRVALREITSMASVTTEDVRRASGPEIEAARRSGGGGRELLGRRVRLVGTPSVEGVVLVSFPARHHIVLVNGEFIQVQADDYLQTKK